MAKSDKGEGDAAFGTWSISLLKINWWSYLVYVFFQEIKFLLHEFYFSVLFDIYARLTTNMK